VSGHTIAARALKFSDRLRWTQKIDGGHFHWLGWEPASFCGDFNSGGLFFLYPM
jgi:hypothetical protein